MNAPDSCLFTIGHPRNGTADANSNTASPTYSTLHG